jgi:hypothetical protein
MSPLTGALGKSDLVVLERYADPNALVGLGAKRLTRIIAKASGNQQGHERACEWITAATLALELYADHPAVAFDAISDDGHEILPVGGHGFSPGTASWLSPGMVMRFPT